MRAAVLRAADRPYLLEEVSLDDVRPGELLVRIAGSGMCHTDMVGRDPAFSSLHPIILGHEGSGIVEKVGSGVTAAKPGDHVLISFASCGSCSTCLSGQPAYCHEFEARNFSGRNADGTTSARGADGGPIANRWFGQSSFAEYAIATERNVVVVDPELPLELLGPLGCGLQTGAGAVLNEMRLAPGQSIAVFGAGAVGLAAVMAAKLAGASDIVAVDLQEHRLGLALELGATRVVLGSKDDVVSQVRGAGPGLDFSFETTSAPAVMSASIAVLARPGTAVLVGAGNGLLSVDPLELSGKKVTFVLEGSAVPQIFLPRLISFWRQGRFPFDKLIRTYPLEDINAAEADARSGKTIKPVLLTGAKKS
ncbi:MULTISPECIES: NAD(P)-dependent alcohol dehydrogenase [unclassified Pseudofrankia]|uniref:NAD(P)-dependent alcohol dehydrogenase n=1 Tax=unclassified Pseudofrankia TaxID=2994372 RepID=UPI001F51852E|nr:MULTISPECIES: NAD(P)-dependent alcohol dehydrogenase [unclassified Pseudofrankia]MDT3446634.1 NAD(P)-dependent alcohol dehydrogenase [Pseudofrankia sp. BMG5.37]